MSVFTNLAVPTNAELGLPDFDDSVFGSVATHCGNAYGPGVNYVIDDFPVALDGLPYNPANPFFDGFDYEIDEDA